MENWLPSITRLVWFLTVKCVFMISDCVRLLEGGWGLRILYLSRSVVQQAPSSQRSCPTVVYEVM